MYNSTHCIPSVQDSLRSAKDFYQAYKEGKDIVELAHTN